MLIESIQLGSLVKAPLSRFDAFFSQTAYIISHKDEPVKTLLGVLAFLPMQSIVIIVTNCPAENLAQLKQEVASHSAGCEILLVHQKDPVLAAVLRDRGVFSILGKDDLVVDGKGPGMYSGTLCAALLEQRPRWIIFYDADNRVPSALWEYSLAMAQLFLEAEEAQGLCPEDALHNVRVCWSSKPDLSKGWSEDEDTNLLGRCTREVSPSVHQLFEYWFPGLRSPIITSNAGEEGLSLRAARELEFSSGYSVETVLLLGLLAQALEKHVPVLFQQYLAKSPHFHEKGGDGHIRKMIAESLGGFVAFSHIVPSEVMQQVELVCDRLGISLVRPQIYPALSTLGLQEDPSFLYRYRLSPSQIELVDSQAVFAE